MAERPKVVNEITGYLSIWGGIGTIGTVLSLVSDFSGGLGVWQPPRPMSIILTAIPLSIAVCLDVLAYGFYNLRPWAYRPVYYLVKVEQFARSMGLNDKIDDAETRRAFGLEDR